MAANPAADAASSNAASRLKPAHASEARWLLMQLIPSESPLFF
ncbi:MAG TPA: hypothetical protein VJQ42_01360 [Rhodanobacteraceae bacterium]|nr:hypothetical protein [Rhodanobacteraceae bacterium]